MSWEKHKKHRALEFFNNHTRNNSNIGSRRCWRLWFKESLACCRHRKTEEVYRKWRLGVGGAFFTHCISIPRACFISEKVFYSVSEKLEEVFIVFEDANTYECVILAPDGRKFWRWSL